MLKFTMVDISCRMESKLQKWNYNIVKILLLKNYIYEIEEFLDEQKTLIFKSSL